MEYVICFDENSFFEGEIAYLRHCQLVKEGLRPAYSLPLNPYSVGSDAAGCWRLGFAFAMPID